MRPPRVVLRDALPAPLVAWTRRRLALHRSRRPVAFSEKVVYKIHRDRRRILVTFADKVAARDHVALVAPSCRLTQLHAVTTDLRTVERASLPRQFVVKASHASGGVVVVADWASPETATPGPTDGLVRVAVHPDRLDWDRLCAATDAWLRTPYVGPLGEWAYSQVEPRLLVEELLAADGGGAPIDYKLWVFHGRCRVVETATDRFTELTELLFTPAWELIVDLPGDEEAAAQVGPPAALAEMIEIAERLGAGTDFVRVDLYEVEGRVVFGELTNYPGGGDTVIRPDVDRMLGTYWDVPRRYRD
jgi:hypothetical protein